MGALVIAEIVDRALSRRGRKLSQAVGVGELSRSRPRLRLVRRLVFATIVLIGIALAASQIPTVSRLATGILAFLGGARPGGRLRGPPDAGQRIAGILLAITQPIRIGDLVTFEEETGIVEDVKLTYTYIRLDDGRRLIVPNERLAELDRQPHDHRPARAGGGSVWLPPGADVDRAIELIEDEQAGISASVVETDKEGVRLSATTWAESPAHRARRPPSRRWLRLLREHGLSPVEAS